MTTVPPAQRRRSAHLLTHDATRFVEAQGCDGCKDRDHCGGLAIAGGLFNCMVQCCGNPAACGWICRNNPDFVRDVQSFRGFDLTNIEIAEAAAVPPLPAVVPLIYHGYRRERMLEVSAAAIKLVQLFDRRDGTPRYMTRTGLMRQFRIADRATLIVSGVDDDPIIERWWGIAVSKRRDVITRMMDCGVGLVTCPNFSLCLDWPRTGDLAAIKRIAITYEEFARAGLPAALHVNGRTDHDFARWGEFLATHASITHVAYEFTTGASRRARCDMHIAWLSSLPGRAGRPLDLVVYGDAGIAHTLAPHFRTLTWIDTTSFIKAIHRRRAVRKGNGQIVWEPVITPAGAPIDDLIAHNIAESAAHSSLYRVAA